VKKIKKSAAACLIGAIGTIGGSLALAAAPTAAADTTDITPPTSVQEHSYPALDSAPGSALVPYPSGPNPYVTFGTNPFVPFGVDTAF
jgi:hypothetical protein